MKLTGGDARMHAASLRYQLILRAMDGWGATLRYCLIVVVTTGTPALVTWLVLRAH
jgi:hypothetical protein